jgi:hypothetical protein
MESIGFLLVNKNVLKLQNAMHNVRARSITAQDNLWNSCEIPMILVSRHSFHDLVIRHFLSTFTSFPTVTGGRNELLVIAIAV